MLLRKEKIAIRYGGCLENSSENSVSSLARKIYFTRIYPLQERLQLKF